MKTTIKINENEKRTTQYLRLINDMLTDKTFNKSAEYLKSVRDQIKRTDYISQSQMTAINNIYMKFSERS